MSDIEYSEFLEASERKYGKYILDCPCRRRQGKSPTEICRVFETENKKEIEDYALFGKVTPHETASVSYLVPKHLYDANKEGDLTISIRAKDEYTSTSDAGFVNVFSPSTDISIRKTVKGEDETIAQVSFDTYVDISDKKKLAALLNGLYGKPQYAKDLPKVLECFSDFVYKENDLSSAKRYCKGDIELAKVKKQNRDKLRKESHAQNAVLREKIDRETAAENPQPQMEMDMLGKLRNRLGLGSRK